MSWTALKLCRYAGVLIILIGLEMTAAKVNRSKLFRCLHCKGANNTCPSDSQKDTNLCVKPTENCYTMVQADGKDEIVSRGCAHNRFCQMAKQVKLYQLKFCNQCSEESCNNQKAPFTYQELDVDSGSVLTRGDVGLTLLGLLILGTLLVMV